MEAAVEIGPLGPHPDVHVLLLHFGYDRSDLPVLLCLVLFPEVLLVGA